jgi:hypothetical protein
MGTMSAAENTDERLRSAIRQKRLIELVYKERRRIVEPHDYGIHRGVVKLFGFQVGGSSSSPLPNWRWMEVNSLSDILVLNRTFPGRRPNSAGKHHHWDQLFLRVEPPDDEDKE